MTSVAPERDAPERDAPERSLEQRMDALQHANDIRIYRARKKRELKAGRVSVLELMDDPMFATMKIFDLLVTIPKWGRVKVNRVLTMNSISPSKTVGGLSERQAYVLRGAFGRGRTTLTA